MRSELPRGTVTFLFTDVEGSTRLLHELGAEGYAEALAEHRRVIREACAVEGGVEVDTQGDAFFFAFPTAPRAVDAARAIVDGLEPGPIAVRVGVHTGTPHVTPEGYVGADVHRAARIAAAGHGGQVLVSASAAALLDGDALRDLGEHRFKDLAAPERVYQLGERGFPALKSLYRTNLPVPASPLVGRKKELADVIRLVTGDARLVTLTGPGGIGKTRFAVAAAAEAATSFPDGVWFVALEPIRDPVLVSSTIAQAVGADEDLTRHLADAECLLVLDNFEQVIEAAGDVASLLAACPGIRTIVTSREVLRVAPEREYALPPLPESPAVELFRQRADDAAPDVEVAYATAGEICKRLDFLPLAIELAAARVRVFEPDALLERLDERLPLLVTRARDLPERQRTLEATIRWSYELLSEDEQRLLRRLAVFAGGATLDSIEAVADGDADLVESLVDKSLLRRRGERFAMLETVREFAGAELDATSEADDVRRRHAEYFLALAATLNLTALKAAGRRIDVAIAELDNIRAALSWSLESGDAALGLDLATQLEGFWTSLDPHEGARWFAALFALQEAQAAPTEIRAHALRAYGTSTDIAGDDVGARRAYEQSLELFDELGDVHGRAALLHRLAIQAMRRGELEEARTLVEESHELHASLGNTWGLTQTTGTLGAIARDEGDDETAYNLIARSAELAREVQVPWWEAGMLAELAVLSLQAGRVDEAARLALEFLTTFDGLRDRPGRVFGVGVLACVAAERGQPERAGLLWGAIEDELAGAPLGGWRRHRAACEERIRRFADGDFDRGVADGRELSLDEAVELALGA
jgi:predicted ATPase